MARRRGGWRWTAIRRKALDRDGWRCVACGKAGVLEVDHILRVEDFPKLEYDLANLQALCRACHIAKTNRERGVIPLPADWTRLVDDLTT